MTGNRCLQIMRHCQGLAGCSGVTGFWVWIHDTKVTLGCGYGCAEIVEKHPFLGFQSDRNLPMNEQVWKGCKVSVNYCIRASLRNDLLAESKSLLTNQSRMITFDCELISGRGEKTLKKFQTKSAVRCQIYIRWQGVPPEYRGLVRRQKLVTNRCDQG